METKENKEKEDDMIVLSHLTNDDPPSRADMDRLLKEAKNDVKVFSEKKKVHRIKITNGYVLTTRPEIWDDYEIQPKTKW